MSSRRSLWAGAAALATVLVVGMAAFQFFVVGPRVRATALHTKSKDNLAALTRMMQVVGLPPPSSLEGKRRILWLVASGRVDPRNPRVLDVLFSPGDGSRSVEKAGAAFASLTEASLLDGSVDPRPLTSYVGRRSGAPAGPGPGGVPLLADLSFADDGLVLVAFSGGRTETLDRAALGLAPGDPIVVGPASKSPLLAQLSDE